MTARVPVVTTEAPAAIGPYSQAIVSGDWVFLSGQIGLDPATGQVVGADVATQTAQVLRNIDAVLEAAGCSSADIIKTTIFLQSMGDFAAVNALYGAWLTPPFPARSTVAAAGLPRDVLVEIEVIARKPM